MIIPNLTDAEKLMYQIIGSICEMNVPIIFEGALITKLILAENQFTELSRKTVDIDASWIGEPPAMSYLVDILNQSLSTISEDLCAEVKREYEEDTSAGFKIINRNLGKTVTTMDIDIKSTKEGRLYYYGDLTIKGALPTEILSDKIAAISKRTVFRRTKDLIDIYALANCVEIKTIDVYESHQRNNRVLGEFAELLSQQKEINYAFQKLQGIDNKPDFNY